MAILAILNFRSELFYLKVTRYFQSSFESTGLSVQDKKFKIDFQDGHYVRHFDLTSGHLGLTIKMILAVLNVHVALKLSTKFRVNWSVHSGGEV